MAGGPSARRRKAAAQDEREVAANPHRGEHELVLGGRAYLLRPSFHAQMAIEEKTGRALTELVRMGNAGALPLRTAGVIGAELIRAGADRDDRFTANVSAEKISELIFEEGLPGAIARLTLCLVDMATGGRTASGEAKPEAVSPKTGDDASGA